MLAALCRTAPPCGARQLLSKRLLSTCASALASSPSHPGQQQPASSQLAPGILFDIDGVLIRGNQVLAEAKEAFQMLLRQPKKIPFLFVTNGGGTTEAYKAHQLSKWLGAPVREDQIVLSHTPLRVFENLYDKNVLLIGQGPLKEIAASYGYRSTFDLQDVRKAYPLLDIVNHDTRRKLKENSSPTGSMPSIQSVFVMSDPIEWESCLQVLMDFLISADGIPGSVAENGSQAVDIIFSNADFLWMAEHSQPRFGQGAFRMCLEKLFSELTGRHLKYVQLGKPFELTYEFSERLLHAQAVAQGYSGISYFYMVGDNPHSDVRGANGRLKGRSVLVRTGVFPAHLSNDAHHPAHFVVANVLEGVKLVIDHFEGGHHHHGGSHAIHEQFIQHQQASAGESATAKSHSGHLHSTK